LGKEGDGSEHRQTAYGGVHRVLIRLKAAVREIQKKIEAKYYARLCESMDYMTRFPTMSTVQNDPADAGCYRSGSSARFWTARVAAPLSPPV
jgi:hypothetical protein